MISFVLSSKLPYLAFDGMNKVNVKDSFLHDDLVCYFHVLKVHCQITVKYIIILHDYKIYKAIWMSISSSQLKRSEDNSDIKIFYLWFSNNYIFVIRITYMYTSITKIELSYYFYFFQIKISFAKTQAYFCPWNRLS